jgi:hypothetical protein
MHLGSSVCPASASLRQADIAVKVVVVAAINAFLTVGFARLGHPPTLDGITRSTEGRFASRQGPTVRKRLACGCPLIRRRRKVLEIAPYPI